MIGASKNIWGFDPRSVPGCSLWLDAADSSSITIATGVSQWRDKSSNAYSLTQSTTASRPTYSSNLVTFASDTFLNIPQGAMNNLSNWSIFTVINPISSSNWIMVKQKNGANIYNVLSMTYNTSDSGANQTGSTGFLYWRSLNAGSQGISTQPINTSSLQILNLTYDGSNLYFYKNGVLEKTTTGSFAITNDTNATNFTMGIWIKDGTTQNSAVTNFKLGEMVVYSTFPNTNQRQQIEGYLAWKWGLSTTYNTNIPTSISGLALWLDAADTSTITPSTGGTLTAWTDKSGTGKTITINSAPSYATTGFNGNYPCMTFTSGNNLTLTIPSVGTGDIAIFAVWKQTTSSTQQNVFSIGSPGGGTETAMGWNNSEKVYKFYRFSGAQSTNNSAANNANIVGSSLQVSGVRTLHINGNPPITSGTESYNQTNTTAYIGGGTFPLVGQLAELIFYIGTVTTDQRQSVEDYLSRKWGILSYDPGLPKSITGCLLWLDGNDLTSDSMTLTGNTVNTWKDKSGSGYNFTQNSFASSTLPPISNIGTGTGVYFGSLQGLRNTSLPFPTNYTIFAVANQLVNSVNYQYILHSPHNADFIIFFGANRNNFATFAGSASAWNDVASNSPTSSIANTSNNVSLLCCTNNGTTLTPYFNTVAMTTKTGTNASTTGMIIGCTFLESNHQPWLGTIGEIIIYNSVLTTTQRQQVENYLSRKWVFRNTYGQLPLNHPFYYIKPHSRNFDPTDVPDCIVWLDASDQTTITPSAGGALTSWTDKSGKGNSIVNISTTAPTYATADSSVSFNALSLTNLRGSLSTTYSNEATAFAVVSMTVPGTTTSGLVTTYAGVLGNTTPFWFPYGIAVNPNGVIYVGNTYRNIISAIATNGTVTTFSTGYNLLLGIAYDVTTSGLWVADSQNGRVVKLNSSGSQTNSYYGFNIPSGVTVDSNGNCYVADSYNNVIKKITSGGTVSTVAGSGTAGYLDGFGTGAQFYNPRALGLDPLQTNIYVCDSQNHRIRRIVISTGEVTTIAGSGVAGGLDGLGTAAQFNYPYGVCSDGASNLYIAGFADQNVRKIALRVVNGSLTGSVTTWAGNGTYNFANGTGSNAMFKYPSAIGIDSSSNLYVADNNNQLVRKIVSTTASAVLVRPRIATLGVSNASVENSLPGQTLVANSNVLNIGTFVNTGTNPTGQGSNLQTFLTNTSYTNKLLLTNTSIYSPSVFAVQTRLNGNTQAYGSAIGSYTADSSYGSNYNRYGLGAYLNGGAWEYDSFNGKIFEYLLYSRALTDSQRQQVESYLAWKWGIRDSLTTFSPLNILGCQLWLDAADSSSISGTTTVTQWRDKSGNGRHLGVGSGTTSYSSSAIQLSASYMFVTSDVNLTNLTVFIVAKTINVGNQTVFEARPNAGYDYDSVDGFSFFMDSQTGVRFYGKIPSGQYSTFTVNTATPQVFSFQSTGTSISGWYNGVSQTGATLPSSRTSTAKGFAIGGSWNGSSYDTLNAYASIYEIITYNTILTTTERQQVEGYLSQKWSITSTNSIVQHPYKLFPSPSVLPFLPTNISGCAMWLDANDPTGTGTQPATGTIIRTWMDKSGNLNNATDGTTTFQRDSRGGFINFTGSQKYTITNPSIVVGQYFSVFFVEQLQNYNSSLSYSLLGGTTASANANLTPLYRSNSGQFAFAFYANDLNSSPPAFTTNEAQPNRIWSLSYTASLRTIHLNGLLIASDTNNTNLTAWTGATIGSLTNTNFYNGKMREIIIYSGTITASQRQQVEGYLAWKWKLTDSSSPFPTPRTITGCQLWLDAKDPLGTGVQPANGATVSTWVDKSGNGRNATGVSSPTYSLTTNRMTMNGTSYFTLPDSTMPVGNSFYTIFFVGSTSLPANKYPGILTSGSQTSNTGVDLYFYPTGQIEHGWYNNNFTSPSNVVYPDQTYIISAGYTTSYMDLYVNGILVGSKNPGGVNVGQTTSNFLGRDLAGSHVLTGTIAEVIIYTNYLTTAQRLQVEGYLAQKWGIQASSISSPTSIPGCQLWFDGKDPAGNGVQPADGANVSTWVDKSGNGRNATVVTTPLAKSAATYSTAYSALNFVDSNRAYVTTYPANPVNETVFVVFNNPSPTTNNYALIDSQLGGRALGTAWANATNAGTRVAYLNNDVAWSTAVTPELSYTAGTTSILTGHVSNSTTQLIALNGSNFVSGAFSAGSGFSNSTFTYLGWNANSGYAGAGNPTMYYYIGYAMEIIFYNSVLNTTQRQQVENYLAIKWGIQTSSFIPTSIPGCQVWFDGNDPSGNGVQPANGATVSTWVDKSGNGYNATIASGKVGATYSTAYSALNFATSTTGYVSTYPANPTTETMFVVFNNPSPSTNNFIIIGGQIGARGLGAGSTSNGVNTVGNLNNHNSWLASTSASTYVSGSTVIVTSDFTSTTNSVSLNGGTAVTGGSPGFTAGTTTYLGMDARENQPYHYVGYAMEIIFYNSVLTTDQRKQVENYLALKWGIVPRIISGCQLWLDGADPAGTGVIPANGSVVSSWVDKSGNSRNGTQNNNPTYDLAKRAIYFSGASQFYSLPNSTFPTGNSSYSYFMIVNFAAAGAASNVGVLGGGGYTLSTTIAFRTNGAGGGTGFFEYWYNNDNYSATTFSNDKIVSIGSIYETNVRRTLIQDFRTFTIKTTGLTRNQASTSNAIGRSFSNAEYMIGHIHEVIVYNTALNGTQRKQIENYLAVKWGINAFYPLSLPVTNPTRLPASHPYYNTSPLTSGITTMQPYYKFPPASSSPSEVLSFSASGGAIVKSGSFTYHVFTATASFVVSGTKTINYLFVGGGGGGGDRHGGGGGAGGVITGTYSITTGTYTVTVGAGGAGGNFETNSVNTPQGCGLKGGDTTISGVNTGLGGGGGGTYNGPTSESVGSGGGGGGAVGSANSATGSAGTAGQGNSGGNGQNPNGGGGGGAGAAGSAAVGTNGTGGAGGAGTSAYSAHLLAAGYGTTFAVPTSPNTVISGGVAYIAGGGGGGAGAAPGPGGAGGVGGGGRGDWDNAYITAGTPNTGGGGGGCRSEAGGGSAGYPGGSGLALIWY